MSDKIPASDKPLAPKSPTPRKSLIAAGSILSAPAPGGSILENVIERDREKNGRAALSQPEEEATMSTEANTPAADEATTQSDKAEVSASKDILTDLSKQVSKPLSTALSKSTNKRVSKSSLQSSSMQVSPVAEKGGGQSARRRLLDHAEKEAVTRLSIDVPQSMYGRIKQYVAVHNVESIRALTLALYADFLEEEGF